MSCYGLSLTSILPSSNFRSSKAKIVIERSTDEKDPNAPKKVTISGSGEQIELAKSCIEEQLEEDKAFRMKQQIAAELRGKKATGKKCAVGGGGGRGAEQTVPPSRSSDGLGESSDTAVNQRHISQKHLPSASGDAPLFQTPMQGNTQIQLPDHKNYFDVFG